MSPTRADVLVLGGGLAGAAAAIALARAGRQVVLLEREAAPRHKVCGEFLSAEALGLLTELGLPPALAGLGALPIHAVRLAPDRHGIGTGLTEARLPFAAQSLTRRQLDPALLRLAATAGADVRRGAAVTALGREDGRWIARVGDGTGFQAPAVLLATGKHDLRGHPRPPGRQNDLVALKLYLRLEAAEADALAGHVELLLHRGGYTGLQPSPEGGANLCALVQRGVLAELSADRGCGEAEGQRGAGVPQNTAWDVLLADLLRSNPHARRRLAGAEPLLARPLAVASIPYGFVRREAMAEGLWAVGDQAAVIPSFTGDGMSIALYTGLRAARGILCGESAEVFQRRLYHDLHAQVARATLLSRLLVRQRPKQVLTAAAHMLPMLLSATARLTRIPRGALNQLSF